MEDGSHKDHWGYKDHGGSKDHGDLVSHYKIDTTELNLLPNERLESFWDALWLGIRPFLCLIEVRLIVEVTLIHKAKSEN